MATKAATYLLTYMACMFMLIMWTSIPFVQSHLISFYSISLALFGTHPLI